VTKVSTNHSNTPFHILALDTSCGSIAACIIGPEYSYESQQIQNAGGVTRSTSIVPLLSALLEQADLAWNQLDVLVLGAGPGSFTGLRIAAATLAGINAGLHLPVVHVSSLAITARQIDSGEKAGQDEAIRVLEDARAGEAFCGYYRHGTRLEADACLNWTDIERLKPGRFCCHGKPPIDMSHWVQVPLLVPRSRALMLEAQAACAQVEDWTRMPVYPAPAYLQLSQAERQANEST